MSNQESDGFIDEVTEALRRDQLFAAMRRYGWIAALLVVALVGGAAWYEYTQARDASRAQALGGAMLDALDAPSADAAVAGLKAISAEGEAAVLLELLTAAAEVEDGDRAAAADRLGALASTPDLPRPYADLARLKALMLRAGTMDEAELQQALEAIAAPGAPFRMLAEEQIVGSLLRQGDNAAAIERLMAMQEDAAITDGQKQRVTALLLALGVPEAAQPAADPDPAGALDETQVGADQ